MIKKVFGGNCSPGNISANTTALASRYGCTDSLPTTYVLMDTTSAKDAPLSASIAPMFL